MGPLLKREKDLVPEDPPGICPTLQEMAEVVRIFHLKPGMKMYKIKSELTEEANEALRAANKANSAEGNETIYMNMRSVLQIMTFLSKGVCIPDDHVLSGVVPITPDSEGQPFDWTVVTAGNFLVHVQKHRPRGAEVAVLSTAGTGSTSPVTM